MQKENSNTLLVGLLIATIFILGFNSYQIGQINNSNAGSVNAVTGSAVSSASNNGIGIKAMPEIMPKGVPKIYGEELKISFDDISIDNQAKTEDVIETLALLDQSINLDGKDKERYINILYKMENGISCEYCCGARAIIFENGEPACGCAHSFAMRGLTKYLITEHGNEYTDEEILEEVGKLKTLFFPTQIQAKANILESKGIELNYINLASNKYRGIEKGVSSQGGMVGGC